MRKGKSELVDLVAEKSGLSKKDASKAIDAVFEGAQEILGEGDSLTIVGFGTFDVRERKARTGTHPQTKKPLEIPAKKMPAFSAGKALKEAVK